MKRLSNNTIVAASVLIILFPLGYSLVGSVFSQVAESSQPFLELPDEKYDACLLEQRVPPELQDQTATYVRFHHMDILKDIRNEAVRTGQRGEIGLNSCRQCHTSRQRFCAQCHSAVNLNPDCFRCHYYPD